MPGLHELPGARAAGPGDARLSATPGRLRAYRPRIRTGCGLDVWRARGREGNLPRYPSRSVQRICSLDVIRHTGREPASQRRKCEPRYRPSCRPASGRRHGARAVCLSVGRVAQKPVGRGCDRRAGAARQAFRVCLQGAIRRQHE